MNAAGRAGRRREAAGRAGRRREAALAAQVTSGGACAQEKIDEAAEDARVMRVQKEQATQHEKCAMKQLHGTALSRTRWARPDARER
jgi:hypothetical protein